jgi:predicted DNA-binding transcriptional regulator YafY
MGSKVEVISPLYLRDSIIQEMRTALSKVNINVELD